MGSELLCLPNSSSDAVDLGREREGRTEKRCRNSIVDGLKEKSVATFKTERTCKWSTIAAEVKE